MAEDEREHALRPTHGIEPGAISILLKELAVAPAVSGDDAWQHVLSPGLVVGKFELVREIGRGGFGVVWEARDRELSRSVAFKAVRVGGDVALREERLLREAEASASLSHPNLVTLFDAGRGEHGPFLVMELLHGSTLSRRLEDGPLPVAEALRIARAVARGVAHAHEHGVVHRDLKPDNVFLCDDGQVKVLDLGLAHAFGHRRVGGGTPAYMAPEQLEGAPEDERTDVFALGVMLFEMLAGQRPFATEKALRSPTAAPALDMPDQPALAKLISRMLAKRAVERPRDGGEVVAALAAVDPVAPGAASRGSRSVRARRQRGLPALLAAGAVVALGGGAVLAWRHSSLKSAVEAGPPSIAVLPFADLSPQKDQEYLADGVAEEILTAVSRVKGLRVAGRTSSFHFKGRSENLRAIGEQLRVSSVLEGSVRREGDRIRVSAQLVNVADGYRRWSETFDRNVTDIFAVQDEIARAVAAGLRLQLLDHQETARAARTANADAYAELLKGNQLFRRGTGADCRSAVEAFERSIALDPGYAPAHAALSIAQANLLIAYDQGSGDLAELSRASAERALALAPLLADGYVARALVRWGFDHDWLGSLRDLEKALSLDPYDPPARYRHAQMLATLGRVEEAIAAMHALLRDDPLSADAGWMLGNYYNATARHDLARDALNRALQIEPQHERALGSLALTEILDKHPEAALDLSKRTQSEFIRRIIEAMAYHDLDRTREAGEAVAWLEQKKRYAYSLADVYAWRGDRDRAFASLEEAVATRDAGVRAVKYDVFLRSLRDDPRYPAFLKRVKLPAD